MTDQTTEAEKDTSVSNPAMRDNPVLVVEAPGPYETWPALTKLVANMLLRMQRDGLSERETAEQIIEIVKTDSSAQKLRAGLAAATRAAKLAMFWIEKHGVPINDSWRAGFDRDMATAEAAPEPRDAARSLGQSEYEAWLRWITAPGDKLEPTWAALPQADKDYWTAAERINDHGG